MRTKKNIISITKYNRPTKPRNWFAFSCLSSARYLAIKRVTAELKPKSKTNREITDIARVYKPKFSFPIDEIIQGVKRNPVIILIPIDTYESKAPSFNCLLESILIYLKPINIAPCTIPKKMILHCWSCNQK